MTSVKIINEWELFGFWFFMEKKKTIVIKKSSSICSTRSGLVVFSLSCFISKFWEHLLTHNESVFLPPRHWGIYYAYEWKKKRTGTQVTWKPQEHVRVSLSFLPSQDGRIPHLFRLSQPSWSGDVCSRVCRLGMLARQIFDANSSIFELYKAILKSAKKCRSTTSSEKVELICPRIPMSFTGF